MRGAMCPHDKHSQTVPQKMGPPEKLVTWLQSRTVSVSVFVFQCCLGYSAVEAEVEMYIHRPLYVCSSSDKERKSITVEITSKEKIAFEVKNIIILQLNGNKKRNSTKM